MVMNLHCNKLYVALAILLILLIKILTYDTILKRSNSVEKARMLNVQIKVVAENIDIVHAN